MDSLEGGELQLLLQGKPVPLRPVDVAAPGEEGYVPITKQTVCYIVSGVAFNDDGEVLMMQEAKSSCYGMWYLPAGRMELNETIEEAVKREVREETGMEFQPTTLLSVDVASGFWYRFTLAGKITGGRLKSYEQRDKESLQAKWCSVDLIKSGRKGFPLRAVDILPLIDTAVKHHSHQTHHPDILPVLKPHVQLLLRIVFVNVDADGAPRLLVAMKDGPHFPLGVISADDASLHGVIFRMIKATFGDSKFHPKVHGVLCLEHSGKPAKANDGICLTLLISIATSEKALPPIHDGGLFAWSQLGSQPQRSEVLERLKSGVNVPLFLLR